MFSLNELSSAGIGVNFDQTDRGVDISRFSPSPMPLMDPTSLLSNRANSPGSKTSLYPF